jgi:hypothetical protein
MKRHHLHRRRWPVVECKVRYLKARLVWVTAFLGRAGKGREGVSASDRPAFTIAYDSPTVPLDHPRTIQCRSPSTLPLRRRPRGHLTFYVAPPARVRYRYSHYHPRHSGRECSRLLRIHAMEAIRNLFASWSPIVRHPKDADRTTTATLLRGDRLHFPGLIRGSDRPAAGNL